MKLKWILLGLAAVVIVAVGGIIAYLSTLNFDDLREIVRTEAKKATGRDLVIAGPIELDISLAPAIRIQDVSLSNAEWAGDAEMVTVKEFDLKVSLTDLLGGEIRVERLILVEPRISLETDAEGRGNWEFDSTEAEAASGDDEIELASFDRVEIQDGSVSFKDGRSGTTQSLALKSLTATAESMSSPVQLAVDGTYDATDFSAEGTIGALRTLNEGPYAVDLKGMIGGAEFAVAGSAAKPLSGDGVEASISVKGDSLAKLAAIAGADAPALGPIDLSAKLVKSGADIGLSEIDARLGPNHISGDIALVLGESRPAINGALTVETLDLTSLAPPAKDAAGEAPAGRFVFTEDPLPLDGLHAVDADLELRIGSAILASGLRAENLRAAIKLANGRLTLSPLVTGLSGGTVDINLDLNDSKGPPRINARLDARAIDFGRLLKDMDLSQDVTGKLDGKAAIQGAGASPRAIASGLNGSLEIVRGQGTIDDRLFRIAAAGLDDILSPMMGEDDKMKLNCLAIKFDIVDGLATSKALIVDTDAFTILGGGTIDLKTEEIDLTFDTESKGVNLTSLATAFNVHGTLAQPSASPDAAAMAVGAAKIAGTVFMPIPAIVSMIGDSQLSGSDQNPCLVALEKAQQQAAEGAPADGDKTVVEDAAEGIGGAVEDVGEGISEGLKSLFGD
ncbi:MAG: AsmA family protein [Alphaproteobacteria bacterium]|nr:AsmA family protein [Alphaproteobacteria bacterium]